jgi:hypothetical protein
MLYLPHYYTNNLIMATENKGEHVCMSGMCGNKCEGCGYNHMHLMKKLIKMALVIIILCFAFKIGEIKGFLEATYGHDFMGERRISGDMMMYGNTRNVEWNKGTSMMDGQTFTVTTPATSATPAVPKK